MPINRIVFTATLGELAEVPGTPFAYWAPKTLRDLFQKFPPLDRDVARQPDKPKIADVKVGLQTSDDLRFTRFWWEVPVEQIALSREETFQSKPWVPFAKGGRPFYQDIALVVKWGNDGEEIKHFRDNNGHLSSRPQNEAFYFRGGLRSSNIASSNRLELCHIQPGIFSHACRAIFLQEKANHGYLMGLLNSQLYACLFWMLDPLAHNREGGTISRLPVKSQMHSSVAMLSSEVHDLVREWDTGNEVSSQFIKPCLLQTWHALRGTWNEETARPATAHPLARDFAWSDWGCAHKIRTHRGRDEEEQGSPPLWELAQMCVERETTLRQRLEEIQQQIDDEVYRLYGISDEDRALIEAELGRAPEQEEAEEAGAEEPNEEALPEGIMPAEEHIRRLVHYLAHQVVWEDPDGIVPLNDIYTADGRLERSLGYKVRERLRDLFGEGMLAGVEGDLRQALGRPLEEWLETEVFSYHVGLYRLRPIIWQLASQPRGRLAFACFLDWHRLDADTLRKVQEVYLRPAGGRAAGD